MIGPMSASAGFDILDGMPDLDTVYTRCPTCGVVATAAQATYVAPAHPGLTPGWQIELTCIIAGHSYVATASSVLARDGAKTCSRPSCGTTFPVPADADEVVCTGCRLHQPGPSRSGHRSY